MALAFNLSKGMTFNLEKETGITRVLTRLTWNAAPADMPKFDADLSAAALAINEKNEPYIPDMPFLASYVHKLSEYKIHEAFNYGGDERDTGKKAARLFETIGIDLTKIPDFIEEIALFATIDKWLARGQVWGSADAVIELLNAETNEVLCRYDVGATAANCTAFQFASMFRTPGGWDFKAIGTGFEKAGIEALLRYWKAID